MPSDDWTFLTNYGHVLVALSKDPTARMRDLAEQVGITERAVQQIVGELVAHGYVVREKSGRRNRYSLADNTYMRHPLEGSVSIADFIATLGTADDTAEDGSPTPGASALDDASHKTDPRPG